MLRLRSRGGRWSRPAAGTHLRARLKECREQEAVGTAEPFRVAPPEAETQPVAGGSAQLNRSLTWGDMLVDGGGEYHKYRPRRLVLRRSAGVPPKAA